jgi:hypothetical protein
MEQIKGKHALNLDALQLHQRAHTAWAILIDIGTGDGRFVRETATTHPEWLVLGVDACRENLRAASRQAPENALYLIANALELPAELHGLAHHLTINFPWGSLLSGLLQTGDGLVYELARIMQPNASIVIRVNAGALEEQNATLEAGVGTIRSSLAGAGFQFASMTPLDAGSLRAIPTTWAKRLAFGRDPRAVELIGTLIMARYLNYG